MTSALRIDFSPLLGWPLFWGLAVTSMAGLLFYGWLRGRAWVSRVLATGLALLAIANPALIEEEREPLPSVVAVIVDRSDSMSFGERAAIADRVKSELEDQIAAVDSLELRLIEIDGNGEGTHIFSALQRIMADVPRDRIAGAILVTDGQVHDAPEDPTQLVELGPIHAILTGDREQQDRRITLVETPKFGIVGETASFVLRVDDPDGDRVAVSISTNGGQDSVAFVEPGMDTHIQIDIERRGDNIVVFEAPAGRQELTLSNNRTAANVSGVRDGLRVLLVTGRPNSAGRVWRDLLKSDPSVDLVHFTILRPPYKSDQTPLEEMALIAFPTEELFEEKLDSFDLVIFDQYERRGVITMAYLHDVASYVDEGGALLIVAGEDFAGPSSLANTPLAAVLPALPTGNIITGRTQPERSDAGRRHTVTQTLDDSDWGVWLRYVEADAETGDVLMTSETGAPLLAVDRVGDGRVGQLLSDHIWLWARGYDGGGPFADLIRRLVHWLMKEPELDERQLQLVSRGDTIQANLRTLSERAAPLTIETPSGAFLEPPWQSQGPGSFSAEVPVDELGLFRARSGGLEAVILNGPANPVEFAALTVSGAPVTPVTEATRGGQYFIDTDGAVPDIRLAGRHSNAVGSGWLGLRERDAYAVRSARSVPLLPGLLGTALLLLLLAWVWRREGR